MATSDVHTYSARGAYRRLVKGYTVIGTPSAHPTPAKRAPAHPSWVAESANPEYEAFLLDAYDKQFNGESMGAAMAESSAVYFAY